MALNFSDGVGTTVISRPPRVITTYDTTSGCPPVRASYTPMCTTTIVTNKVAWVYIQGHMIRNYAGRTDLSLYATGANSWSNSPLRVRLNYSNQDSGGQWDHTNIRYTAYLNVAGTYTFWLSGLANVWGCGSGYGSLSILVMEV
jgi:hypothetical protein